MKLYTIHTIILFVLFTSCGNPDSGVIIEASNENLKLVNGILELDNQLFSGHLVIYFTDGNLKSETQYLAGKQEGYEKHWFENGSLAMERHYSNGLKVGIHKAWWDNGNPKFIYHFNSKGSFHGNVKEWYASGQLYMDFNYENGQEVGSQRLWKLEGNIKANYKVVNGERFGLIGLKKCYIVTANSNEIK